MSEQLNHVSGQITVLNRTYSAKDVVMALLEQGITVHETPDGLRIGLKVIRQQLGNNSSLSSSCPISSSLETMNNQISELTRKIEKLEKKEAQSTADIFTKPVQNTTKRSIDSYGENSDDISTYLRNAPNYLDDRTRCSVCGSMLPKKAFFCIKCGTSIRSA